jgi:glycosyltransferase involved in cell wall biosynthesis
MPGAQLAILGDGELRTHLQARAEALGVADSVRFCGHRDDLARLYPAFDWLLVPSRSEGLGLVLQEAVLSGVPVICSDLPVFREQLGEAGCYLPVGDQPSWAEAIASCVARDGPAVAREQWQALAPEQGWAAFKAGSASLLGLSITGRSGPPGTVRGELLVQLLALDITRHVLHVASHHPR